MRILPCCLALAVLGTPLHAQALEDKITDLFIFGEGEQVLFLGGSGGGGVTLPPQHRFVVGP
jgi:hypothetical protein